MAELIPDGYRVSITGGGGHLGSAIALELARYGARVLVSGRTESPLRTVRAEAIKRDHPGEIHYRLADISRSAEVAGLIDWMGEHWGGLDGWVNNASPVVSKRFLEGDPDLTGEAVRAAAGPYMTATELVADRLISEGRPGAIVNIASMYGVVSPDPALYEEHPEYHNPPGYGAAKAAILQYTRYAGCHLAQFGIRVNAVSPGPFPKSAIQGGSPGFVKRLARRVPLGRIGKPEEVASPVCFLLSPSASFIIGHNLIVDGGWTVW